MSDTLSSSTHIARVASFLSYIERSALDQAIDKALSDVDAAYAFGRRIGEALTRSAHQPRFVAGLNDETLECLPLPPSPEDADHQAPEPPAAPSGAGSTRGRRRSFDHDLARFLRKEGVKLAKLAAFFEVTEASIIQATKGVKRHKGLASFDRIEALLLRDDGHSLAEIARRSRSNPQSIKSFFDRYANELSEMPVVRRPARKFDHDKARLLRREGCTPTQIAEYFGVHRKTVSDVIEGVEVNRTIRGRTRWNKCAALAQIDAGCDPRDVARTFGVQPVSMASFVSRLSAGEVA